MNTVSSLIESRLTDLSAVTYGLPSPVNRYARMTKFNEKNLIVDVSDGDEYTWVRFYTDENGKTQCMHSSKRYKSLSGCRMGYLTAMQILDMEP